MDERIETNECKFILFFKIKITHVLKYELSTLGEIIDSTFYKCVTIVDTCLVFA